jgi:type II secretory pathway pseudopilin PulG
MTRRIGRRSGRVLLEVLAGMAVLSIVAPAIMRTMADAAAAVARHEATAAIDASASGLLDAVATWTRSDLQRRLGVRRQGTLQLVITQVSASVFFVEVRDSTGVDLRWRTALYRPVMPDAS